MQVPKPRPIKQRTIEGSKQLVTQTILILKYLLITLPSNAPH